MARARAALAAEREGMVEGMSEVRRWLGEMLRRGLLVRDAEGVGVQAARAVGARGGSELEAEQALWPCLGVREGYEMFVSWWEEENGFGGGSGGAAPDWLRGGSGGGGGGVGGRGCPGYNTFRVQLVETGCTGGAGSEISLRSRAARAWRGTDGLVFDRLARAESVERARAEGLVRG